MTRPVPAVSRRGKAAVEGSLVLGWPEGRRAGGLLRTPFSLSLAKPGNRLGLSRRPELRSAAGMFGLRWGLL